MIDDQKEFRVGVGDAAGLRSQVLKIWRQNGQLYVMCSGERDMKVSVHNNMTRYALDVGGSQPRKAFNRGNLNPLAPGRFVTFCRVFLTSHDAWTTPRGVVPKKPIMVAPTEFVVVTLGLSPHHPDASFSTKSDKHRAAMKVSERRFCTITVEEGLLERISRMRPEVFHRGRFNLKKRVLNVPGIPGIVDVVTSYQTEWGTHTFWIHHGLPAETAFEIVDEHPLAKASGAADAHVIINQMLDMRMLPSGQIELPGDGTFDDVCPTRVTIRGSYSRPKDENV